MFGGFSHGRDRCQPNEQCANFPDFVHCWSRSYVVYASPSPGRATAEPTSYAIIGQAV